MLISMPTGTSTIFGVFQAILALLVVNRTNSALNDKLMRNENFASEIFFHEGGNIFMLQRNRNSPAHRIVRLAVKPKTDQWVQSPIAHSGHLTWTDLIGRIADKELVGSRRSATSALNRSGILAMPRYFFNTRIGDELISDPEGEELRNPDRAWQVARAMIRELLKTEGPEGGLLKAILEVTDDEGEIVLEFPFAEAILDLSDTPVTKH
jgi:hypothetical protein